MVCPCAEKWNSTTRNINSHIPQRKNFDLIIAPLFQLPENSALNPRQEKRKGQLTASLFYFSTENSD
jgi:hypothetical protein